MSAILRPAGLLLTFLLPAMAPALADDAAGVAAVKKTARPHHAYLIGDLRVTRPWIDVSGDAASDASGYLVVENHGGTADRLISASATGADVVAVAGPDNAAAADGLTVPPHGKLVLQPGSGHLVVHGLANAAKGTPLAGSLTFARAGALPLSFSTDRIGADDDDQSDPPESKPVDTVQ